MQYPQALPFDAAKNAGAWGYTDRGTGYVIRYVEEELTKRGVVKYLTESQLGNWKNAGLRITTTIDPRIQKAMEAQLNREVPGSALSSQAPNIIGAGVALDPATGRVLAYYGGTNSGANTDWAGKAGAASAGLVVQDLYARRGNRQQDLHQLAVGLARPEDRQRRQGRPDELQPRRQPDVLDLLHPRTDDDRLVQRSLLSR